MKETEKLELQVLIEKLMKKYGSVEVIAWIKEILSRITV